MDPLIHVPLLLALRHPRIKPSPIARLWVLQIVFLRFWRNKGGLEYGRRVSADLCSRLVGLPVSPNPSAVGKVFFALRACGDARVRARILSGKISTSRLV